MSKIDELIKQLCPDGIELKKLWEVTYWDKRFNAVENYKQPQIVRYKYFLASELKPLIVEGGDIKILTTNISNLYTSEDLAEDNYSEGEIIAIPWGGNPIIQYYNGKFLTSDNRIAVSIDSNYLNTKYLYFYLLNNVDTISTFYRGAGIKHPNMSKVLDFQIPIPPLAIQEKIVNILDTFTTLEAELEAELEARKKQYTFYRDSLLSFEGKDVEWKALGEVISSLRTGLNPRNNFKLNEKNADNYYITVRELNGFTLNMTDKTDRVNSEGLSLIQNRSKIQVGDILFSGTGTIGRTAYVADNPINWNVKEGIYVITPINNLIDPNFLIYLIQSSQIHNQILAKADGSTVASISMSSLQKIKIPLPNIDVQKKIVDLLDKFYALANDISIGLPAEILARRKQYEYYRNQLLTFNSISNE